MYSVSACRVRAPRGRGGRHRICPGEGQAVPSPGRDHPWHLLLARDTPAYAVGAPPRDDQIKASHPNAAGGHEDRARGGSASRVASSAGAAGVRAARSPEPRLRGAPGSLTRLRLGCAGSRNLPYSARWRMFRRCRMSGQVRPASGDTRSPCGRNGDAVRFADRAAVVLAAAAPQSECPARQRHPERRATAPRRSRRPSSCSFTSSPGFHVRTLA
jgi:hypothetical protein